jgi:uncharacterized secreted protein with C-terminal beta-propeller domain
MKESEMSNKARNEQLAAELLSQVEDLVEDFIRDNLDQDLEMDDLVEQHEFITQYIQKNMFRTPL